MTNTRNILPVAVSVVSGGGDTGRRSGGTVASLSEISSGSFALGTATSFRLQANLRSSSESVIIIAGYTNPVTLENAEYILSDQAEVRDSVPASTTIYFSVIDTMLLDSTDGGSDDYLILTKYQ